MQQNKIWARRAVISTLAIAATLGTVVQAPAQGVVNVYSNREPGLYSATLDEFTKATGIKINALFSEQGLAERIKAEAENSPADVLITVDIGRLQEAVDLGIAQPVRSEILAANIPSQYRDPDGRWFALSLRARTVYASKERVPQTAISYEELADPKWKGKICTRSGQQIYNNALFAAYLAHHGEAKTEEWLKGVKANLAQKPSGGDREVARDITASKCDIGLGNTYYWALMLNKEPDKKAWADATKVILPTFADGGTHVNVSGVVLAKNAPNKTNGMKLIEWLVSEPAQRMYADMNFEYPVRDGIALNPTIAAYGTLKPDPIAITKIADHKAAAAKLVDKVGFDN